MKIATPYLSFETERLILKPFEITDASFLLTLLNSPKWLQYIGDRNVHTEAEAADYISVKMIPQLDTFSNKNQATITSGEKFPD